MITGLSAGRRRQQVPLDLVRLFRQRMLPLVVGVALVVAAAAPVASHVQRRRALLRGARADAERVALVLRGEIEQNPLLWRYSGVKLGERLGEEGLLGRGRLVLRDQSGAEVDVALPAADDHHGAARFALGVPRRVLWGRSAVVIEGTQRAAVWVGQDLGPLWRETAWLSGVFAVLAAVLAAVLYLWPMLVIAAAERRIRGLTGRLLWALQEEDRRRVARELHDGVGQALTAARLQALAYLRRGGDEQVRGLLPYLDEAVEELRRATRLLAVPALGELGLAGALRRHCEIFAAASGLEVICEVAAEGLAAELEMACYRIVQECLTNTARHGGALRAAVRLWRCDGALLLEVSDDGVGLDERALGGEGRGLQGIRERVELLGGSLRFLRRPERGACVLVRWPDGAG